MKHKRLIGSALAELTFFRWVKKLYRELVDKSDMPVHNIPARIAVFLLILGGLGLLSLLVSASAGAQVAGAAQAKVTVYPKDGLAYVWIPPGTFQMGCSTGDSECENSEKPSHTVTLTKGFWMGQTLVTQVAYKKVMGSNPSRFQGDQLPVEQVTWEDAKAYCERVDMRLPTEAEWEFAARGGSALASYGPLDNIAWYGANSENASHDVGQKQANGYGLYDMLGNVYEWVRDWYGPYDGASAVDPTGPSKGEYHAFRGAQWASLAAGVRVSDRDRALPGENTSVSPRDAIGFRCAAHKDLEKLEK